MRVLHEGLGDSKYRPCPLLVQYVDAGKACRFFTWQLATRFSKLHIAKNSHAGIPERLLQQIAVERAFSLGIHMPNSCSLDRSRGRRSNACKCKTSSFGLQYMITVLTIDIDLQLLTNWCLAHLVMHSSQGNMNICYKMYRPHLLIHMSS